MDTCSPVGGVCVLWRSTGRFLDKAMAWWRTKTRPSLRRKRYVQHSALGRVADTRQMAKQFAAKHALSYLTQVGSVAPRSAAATPVLSRGSSASGAAVSPATPDLEPGGPSSSIFRDVSAISTRLGIESPSYLVEPDADNAGFFTARPVFKKATHVPVDMTVTGVQGHKQAKQRAAELAWDWMDSELQKRQAVYKNLWAS